MSKGELNAEVVQEPTRPVEKKTRRKPVKERTEERVEERVEERTEERVEQRVEDNTDEHAAERGLLDLSGRFELLLDAKRGQMAALKEEITNLKNMYKQYQVDMKSVRKAKRQRDPNAVPRKPTGFAAPTRVSDEMYTFLERYGVERGSLLARPQITKYVTQYVSENKLQNEENRKEFRADDVLSKLLGPVKYPRDKNDAESPLVYGYFNLQKYLSQHFPKKEVV